MDCAVKHQEPHCGLKWHCSSGAKVMQPVYRLGIHLSILAGTLKLLLANKEYWEGENNLNPGTRGEVELCPEMQNL